MTDINVLIRGVQRTYEVDDSGDANMLEFIYQCRPGPDVPFEEVLKRFLVWANGTKWEQFLKDAEPGDIPPDCNNLRHSFVAKMTNLVHSYCEEAEHQDGPEYWDRFMSVREIIDDFVKCYQYGEREYME